MIKGLWKNVLVLGITLVVCLAIAELVIRTFIPPYDESIPRYLVVADNATEYRLSPGWNGMYRAKEYTNHFKISSQGMRDDEHGEKGNTTRILLLGDSFTFGQGVEMDETYGKILEQTLKASGKDVEVINGGSLGYGTRNEYLWLKGYGMAFKPDVIVLQFFMNDFVDNWQQNYKIVDGYLIRLYVPQTFLRTRIFLNDFALYRLAKKAFAAAVGGKQTAPAFMNILEHPENYNMTGYWLDETIAFAQQQHIPLFVMIVPDAVQLRKYGEIAFARFGMDYRSIANMTLPNEYINRIARQHNVTVIDLLPLLNSTEHPYYDEDIHWTKEGHRVVGEYVGKLLTYK